MHTVLVLEDDPGNMQAFSALLRLMGYSVLEATTGTEAIQAGSHHHGQIALLLSDVNLPDCSGTEVALELIRSRPDIMVLFVSGTPIYGWSRNDLDTLKRLPSDRVRFIEKPFPAFALATTIVELIERNSEGAAR